MDSGAVRSSATRSDMPRCPVPWPAALPRSPGAGGHRGARRVVEPDGWRTPGTPAPRDGRRRAAQGQWPGPSARRRRRTGIAGGVVVRRDHAVLDVSPAGDELTQHDPGRLVEGLDVHGHRGMLLPAPRGGRKAAPSLSEVMGPSTPPRRRSAPMTGTSDAGSAASPAHGGRGGSPRMGPAGSHRADELVTVPQRHARRQLRAPSRSSVTLSRTLRVVPTLRPG